VGQVSGARPGAERMTDGRRRGAVLRRVHAEQATRSPARQDRSLSGKTSGAPLLVPSSNTARRNVLEQPSDYMRLPDCDAGRGGPDSDGWTLPAVTHLVQSPAHSEAGGPGWNSEASRGEPEALESALGTVGGA
jgi:hypothetical protein